ncbi:restriction endonuclease subunit S [Pelagirhabdus alkalitolerans]|uniref:restriction endonuclease subunit S n=1 Tax=Pelagirhabdus alkalitolerans TaxID=1612202 RepID=UPI000B885AD2|nr:restriction endonuclease subunit S [Pelagirhabdus alkalitolerans]
MKVNRSIPYKKITKEDWSINAFLAALNSTKEHGSTIEELMDLNPVKIKKTDLQEDTTYEYIDISSLSTEKGIVNNIKEVKGSDLPARATLRVRTGDILLSSVRPARNAVARITEDLSGSLVNNTFIVLRPHNIDLSCLLYFILRSDNVRSKLMLIARGNAIPTIKVKDLKEIRLPIKEVTSDQQQIAKNLYSQWHKNQTSAQSLDNLIESVFLDFDIFKSVSQEENNRTLYSTIPYHQLNKRWDIASRLNVMDLENKAKVSMASLESLTLSFRSGATISKKEYQEKGTPYIGIKNIEKGTMSDQGLVYVSDETAEENSKAIVQPNNVLMSKVGSIGKTGVVTSDFAGALASQHITIIETDQERLLPSYLSYFMMTQWGLTQLQQRASGVAQKFIKLKDIKELQVPILSIQEQEEIISSIKKKESEQSDKKIEEKTKKFTEELVI